MKQNLNDTSMNTNKIYADLIKTNPLEKKFGFADDQVSIFSNNHIF